MNCFAKNLKHFREESGMTQEQLAQSINVTRQAVSRWERGRTEPDIAMITTLARVLDIDAEELISGKKHNTYSQFQKKYLVCSILSFSLSIILFLLVITLGSYLREHIYNSFMGVGAYFLVFDLLFPISGLFSFGIFLVSLIALFRKIYLHKPWKKVTFLLSLVAILPSALVMIDASLAILISAYKAPVFQTLFVATIPSQTLQILLFILSPIVSGILLFLCLNNESTEIHTE